MTAFLLPILASVAAIVPLAAQPPSGPFTDAPPRSEAPALQKVDRRYAIASDASIRFMGSVGTLRVIGWNRDSLAVTGTLPTGARLKVSVGPNTSGPARGAKMFIESPTDEMSAASTLELRVPTGARVWVKSGTANVEAREVTGGLDINVIGGSVRVVASPRELQVEAMDAAVVIEGSPGWTRVKTATGDITLTGSSGDAALTTVSGAVRLGGGSVERARVETVTGAIEFSSEFARGADVTLDTHSGSMDLGFSAKSSFDLNATSITGSVENTFDRTRPTPGREGRGQNVIVSQGWDTARVIARSFKGTIVVRRR
ncbi:MAG: DUF4097 family beta strand repeat-containing protein [Gemmatimonadaceae bacterium]